MDMKGILLDSNGDIMIANGGIVLGDSSEQSVQLLFIGAQGEWKEHPAMGIGIKRMQHGATDRFLERMVRVQLESIGLATKKLNITEKGIDWEGDWKQTK
jgi:hypothetical protein